MFEKTWPPKKVPARRATSSSSKAQLKVRTAGWLTLLTRRSSAYTQRLTRIFTHLPTTIPRQISMASPFTRTTLQSQRALLPRSRTRRSCAWFLRRRTRSSPQPHRSYLSTRRARTSMPHQGTQLLFQPKPLLRPRSTSIRTVTASACRPSPISHHSSRSSGCLRVS